jgi:hypothetical protein
MAKVVVKALAVRFTMLFPIRIVVRSKSGCFARCAAARLVGRLSVSSSRICRKESEVNAVSDPLKKADSMSRMTMALTWSVITNSWHNYTVATHRHYFLDPRTLLSVKGLP